MTNQDKEQSQDFQTVWEGTNTVLWTLIRDQLEENDIEVRALGGELSGAQIGIGQQSVTHRLQVPEKDKEAAKELIEAQMAQQPNEEELEALAVSSSVSVTQPRKNQRPTPLNSGVIEICSAKPMSLGLIGAAQGILVFLLVLAFTLLNGKSSSSLSGNFLLYVFGGFVSGLLAAYIYNLCANIFGGVVLQTHDASKMLTNDFNEGECFFNDRGLLRGPSSRKQLDEAIANGTITPADIVQIGKHIYRADQLP